MRTLDMKKYESVPREIDDHFKLFGKEAWEVDYGEKCPICDSKIDEFENCACDAGGT